MILSSVRERPKLAAADRVGGLVVALAAGLIGVPVVPLQAASSSPAGHPSTAQPSPPATWLGVSGSALFAEPSGASPPPAAAAAEPPPASETPFTPRLMRAAILMETGDVAAAKPLVEAELAADPDSNQGQFLRAQIAQAEGDTDTAIRLYRSMLGRDPGLVRVRLELARAFYIKGDFANAKFHFEQAMAGDVPAEVRQNVDRFMASIRQEKPYRIGLGIAFVPDSNVNTATSTGRVDLFGLPFQLSEDAKRRPGLGVEVRASIEGRLPIEDGVQWLGSLFGQRTEYDGGDFDDDVILAATGPRFVFDNADISLQGTYFWRSVGNAPYQRAPGISVKAGMTVSPEWRVESQFNAQKVDYDGVSAEDGWQYGWRADLFHGFEPGTYGKVTLGFERREAEASFRSYSAPTAGIGVFKDFPLAITASLQGDVTRARYDDAQAIFGVKPRRDVSYRIRAGVLKRDFDVWGFTPTLNYTYIKNNSNQTLFDYDRHQVQVGLAGVF